MKSILIASAAAVALFAGASSAFAQRGPNPDANGDGKITLAEFQAARVARMIKADTDHDGRISKAEFVAMMQARMARFGGQGGGQGPDVNAMFAREDLNGDGYITPDEIEQSAARRFAAMDTDHKGWLSPDEMREGRGGGGGGR